MKPFRNRSILLSIRERPLPVLWLLAFLVPYLTFGVASVPHFHADEIAALHSPATAQAPQWHHANVASEHEVECFLCDWAANSQSQNAVATQDAALRLTATEYSPLVVFPSIVRARSLGARAPPASL
jgi:hypothetical protein